MLKVKQLKLLIGVGIKVSKGVEVIQDAQVPTAQDLLIRMQMDHYSGRIRVRVIDNF